MKSKGTKSSNFRNASNHFTEIAVQENNPAAAALAIHLWIESVDAYQSELAVRRAEITPASASAIPQTTIIWGKFGAVLAIAERLGATPRTVRYNDGQTVVSSVTAFEGGYDDYSGSLAWAEVPLDYPGTPSRFSPRPGCWMSGVNCGTFICPAQ